MLRIVLNHSAGQPYDDEATRKQLAKLTDLMDIAVDRASTPKTREVAAGMQERLAKLIANPGAPDFRDQMSAYDVDLTKMVKRFANDGFAIRANTDTLADNSKQGVTYGLIGAGLLATGIALLLQAMIVPPIRRASAIATAIAGGKAG